MGIIDKSKQIKIKVTEFSNDNLSANTIINAEQKKQESVNAVLKQRDASYRINDNDLQMGIAPTAISDIRRTNEGHNETDVKQSSNPVINPLISPFYFVSCNG